MKQFTLILLLTLTGCATMSTHSSQNTTQTRDFTEEAQTVYRAAMQTAMELNWEITMSDSNVMAFGAKTPVTMSRWDDQVNVFILEKDDISTLTVKSTLGHKPNADHINLFLEKVSEKIK